MKISKRPSIPYKCLPKCTWWIQYPYLNLSYTLHPTFWDLHLLMSQYFVSNTLIGGLNNFQNENVFWNWKERRRVAIWERKEDWHTPVSEKTTGEDEETAHRCPDTDTHITAGCPHGAWCLKAEKHLGVTWGAFKSIWIKCRFWDLNLDLLN